MAHSCPLTVATSILAADSLGISHTKLKRPSPASSSKVEQQGRVFQRVLVEKASQEAQALSAPSRRSGTLGGRKISSGGGSTQFEMPHQRTAGCRARGTPQRRPWPA